MNTPIIVTETSLRLPASKLEAKINFFILSDNRKILVVVGGGHATAGRRLHQLNLSFVASQTTTN